MDMGRLGELLRELESLQEKTVRLRYGLGCQRPAHDRRDRGGFWDLECRGSPHIGYGAAPADAAGAGRRSTAGGGQCPVGVKRKLGC